MTTDLLRLRADAAENRDRLLEAARALFADRGLAVPMREIARRAEVGPATLYRRFPTKQSLIDAAFEDELLACRRIVSVGCTRPDPWQGFAFVLEHLTVLNTANQGFVDAFTSAHPAADVFAAHRRDLLGQLSGLAARAQAAGSLRADFVLDDLVLVLLAGRGLAAAPVSARAAAARRFAALALEGFRSAPGAGVLPPPARLAAGAVAGAAVGSLQPFTAAAKA
ncbi:TetR/AcrR family transcriptional regulator [Frondihabitans cladoniiphilus]|uniref:TetR/AcrR family transcriptional regulator n=1 Tax=Frondihabitans cladoniiphilus TaxID=715785 RepID=A0ABP8WB02_9MICO